MTSTPPPSQPFQPFHHAINAKEQELGPDDSISMVSTSVSGDSSNNGNSNSTSRRRSYADALKTPSSSSSSSSSSSASVFTPKPKPKSKPKAKAKSTTNRRPSSNKENSHTTTTNDNDNNTPYITRHCPPGPGSTYIIVHKKPGGNAGGGSNTRGNQALAVVEGHLFLATPPELLPNPPRFDYSAAQAARTTTFAGTCNWHWHCEESDGWLGFRNAATGLWLGLHKGVVEGGGGGDGIKAGMLDATGCLLGVNEQFCVRKAEAEDQDDGGEEGYVLLKRVDVKNPGFWFPGRSVHLWPTVGLTVINLKVTGVDMKQMTWEFVRVDHDAVLVGRMDEESL
ncbi:hypothetical protein B0T20DRAFT_121711 [Sordaria brevicollis]|uniref:Uncharacterized protein n=1 Tax=Sordaria brevicollis TaxID=83679 RepID=A0AAE0UF35_SORBR|nr:hypothetical protein B0T20DRAFT_121711 [Sordaria brevicollis]